MAKSAYCTPAHANPRTPSTEFEPLFPAAGGYGPFRLSLQSCLQSKVLIGKMAEIENETSCHLSVGKANVYASPPILWATLTGMGDASRLAEREVKALLARAAEVRKGGLPYREEFLFLFFAPTPLRQE